VTVTRKQFFDLGKKILVKLDQVGAVTVVQRVSEISLSSLNSILGTISSTLSSANALISTLDTVVDGIKTDTTSLDGKDFATEAKQDTQETSLNAIQVNTNSNGGKTIARWLLETTGFLSQIDVDTSSMVTDVGTMQTDLNTIATDRSREDLYDRFGALGFMGLLIQTIEISIIAIIADLNEGGLNVAEILTAIELDTDAVPSKLDTVTRNLEVIHGRFQLRYSRTFTTTGNGTLIVRIQPATDSELHEFWIGVIGALTSSRVMTARILNSTTHVFIRPVTVLTVTTLSSLGWPHGGLSILNMIDGNYEILNGEELEISFAGMDTTLPDVMTISMGGKAHGTTLPTVTEGAGSGTFTSGTQVLSITDTGAL